MSKRTVHFKIYRYDQDKDEKPYMQDISVELEPSDKKLLDALVCHSADLYTVRTDTVCHAPYKSFRINIS